MLHVQTYDHARPDVQVASLSLSIHGPGKRFRAHDLLRPKPQSIICPPLEEGSFASAV
jgi:hypothetical protein